MKRHLIIFLLLFVSFLGNNAFAQIQIGDDLSDVDYSRPKDYEIGGITVEGAAPGTPIAVYDLSGKLLGSAPAADGTTSVAVSGREHMVVVRIGERSVKMSL